MSDNVGAKYNNINTNSTTVVSTVPCVLRRVVINNAGASSNVATIYDNTAGSGTIVAVIDTVELNGRYLEYNTLLKTGCTVVVATGTAADLTVVTA
jgi:hypothetical protein